MSKADNGNGVTADWITDISKALRQGLHVVLYGNVKDVFMREGHLLSFRDALDETLEACGYTIRCNHTIPDGITFVTPEMQHEFQQIDRNASVRGRGAGPGAQPAGPRFDTANGSSDTTRTNGSSSEAFATERQNVGLYPGPRNVVAALSAIRNVLGADTADAIVAKITFSDRLCTGNGNCPLDERAWQETIRSAMEESKLHVNLQPERQHLEGMRNALILIADTLGNVPQWLFLDNPRVRLIKVGLPGRDERRAYVRHRWSGFYGCEKVELTDAKVDEFAALTDGMTNFHMETLRMCSIEESLSVEDLPRLVDYFRHGVKDNPWKHVGPNLLTDAGQKLNKTIFGQSPAVESAIRVLCHAVGGVTCDSARDRHGKPKGSLLLVGPTGVGKTELGRGLAECLFGDPQAMRKFDMGEFGQEHQVARLVGAPPGYVGYEQGGELTNYVRNRPFSVVLFDEIEKAHPRIWDIFLSILDDGRLTDSSGQVVYFSNCVIIFTCNIGCTISENIDGRGVRERSALDYEALSTYDAVQDHFEAAVQDFFVRIGRPELFGRIGHNGVVVFDLIREPHIRAIVQKMLGLTVESAADARNCRLICETSVTEAFVQALRQDRDTLMLGGRGIRNMIKDTVALAINMACVSQPDCTELTVIAEAGDVVVRGLNVEARVPICQRRRGIRI